MSAPTIPPEQLERFARELGLTQAILVGWQPGVATHVVTWGDSLTDSAQAGQGGAAIKRALGFPETLCRALSPRVAAALRAYDAEVTGRRDEVTRLHRELAALRAELGAVVVACDAIPDVTISKWACDPGGAWNRVREALRARRAAQGFDVDAADPETAFDEHGWLKQRKGSRWEAFLLIVEGG